MRESELESEGLGVGVFINCFNLQKNTSIYLNNFIIIVFITFRMLILFIFIPGNISLYHIILINISVYSIPT